MRELLHTHADLLAFVLSALLLLIYHFSLSRKLRHNPSYTVQAVNRLARSEWVAWIMAEESRRILGIQTLRNSTMAATFMASTAVLLIIGTLNLSGEANKLASTWHLLNIIGPLDPSMWMVKLLCLVTDFFIAFFSFAMSIRLYNHVGFHISVPSEVQEGQLSPPGVAIHLNRAGHYYSIGMRSYYFAVPLVFWLFGPLLMLLATLVLIRVMYHTDRSPKQIPATATL